MSRQIRDHDEYERRSKWFAHWHRSQPDDNAGMIDLDGVGYCRNCSAPLYLVEATRSRGRKCATVTETLGQLAGIEVLVFYRDDTKPDEILVDWRSANDNQGWVSEARAWEILCSIRRTHICTVAEGITA